MSVYEVTIYEVVKHKTTVEAPDRWEAYNRAYDVIANGPDDMYETEADAYTGDWEAEEV